jgi:predicted RNA-binding Zn-ribbon protein involved in translation (DUF1610 family)
MPRVETDEQPAPVSKTTGSDLYVSRKKPDTVALCPGCGKWAFYRDAKAELRCSCGKRFKPADVRRAKAGDPSG